MKYGTLFYMRSGFVHIGILIATLISVVLTGAYFTEVDRGLLALNVQNANVQSALRALHEASAWTPHEFHEIGISFQTPSSWRTNAINESAVAAASIDGTDFVHVAILRTPGSGEDLESVRARWDGGENPSHTCRTIAIAHQLGYECTPVSQPGDVRRIVIAERAGTVYGIADNAPPSIGDRLIKSVRFLRSEPGPEEEAPDDPSNIELE